jgi:hypothetical protein
MAKIEITNGVVAKIFYGGKGVQVNEMFTKQTGETGTRRYTAWFENPVNFGEGSIGTFSGNLSTKIEKWVDEEGNPKLDFSGQQGQSVQININDCKFIADSAIPAQTQMPAEVASALDAFGWSPEPTHLDDAPF